MLPTWPFTPIRVPFPAPPPKPSAAYPVGPSPSAPRQTPPFGAIVIGWPFSRIMPSDTLPREVASQSGLPPHFIIQVCRGVKGAIPVLTDGEFGLCEDTQQLYIGTLTGNMLVNGGGGGSGTVTSITAGAGLTGGTITVSGTIALDTPGTLSVSSTNSATAPHTHAVTSSSAPGAAASILATDASGIIGSTGTRIVKGWFTDLTVTNAISGSITGNAATATALTTRTLWGQAFDGTGNVSGTLSNVGTITSQGGTSLTIRTGGGGGATSMTLQTTTSGGTQTTALTLGSDQSATFAGTLTGASGAFALSFGSFTGDTTLPTGSVSWTGASNKTVTFTASGASGALNATATTIWGATDGQIIENVGGVGTGIPVPLLVGGRLGLDSNYISTSDQTAKLVLNWNSGGNAGDILPIYDGTRWKLFKQSSQLTIKATDSAQTGGSISGFLNF